MHLIYPYLIFLLLSLDINSPTLSVPVISFKVSSPYGARKNPFTGLIEHHAGVDLATPLGTPVLAATSGVVVFSGRYKGYGNLLILRHTPSLTSHYAHLGHVLVRVGSVVGAKDVLGAVGMSGRTTGAHLHFEVRVSGKTVDPMLLFRKT